MAAELETRYLPTGYGSVHPIFERTTRPRALSLTTEEVVAAIQRAIKALGIYTPIPQLDISTQLQIKQWLQENLGSQHFTLRAETAIAEVTRRNRLVEQNPRRGPGRFTMISEPYNGTACFPNLNQQNVLPILFRGDGYDYNLERPLRSGGTHTLSLQKPAVETLQLAEVCSFSAMNFAERIHFPLDTNQLLVSSAVAESLSIVKGEPIEVSSASLVLSPCFDDL